MDETLKAVLTPEQLTEVAIRGSLKVGLYKVGPNDDFKALLDVLLDVVYPISMNGSWLSTCEEME